MADRMTDIIVDYLRTGMGIQTELAAIFHQCLGAKTQEWNASTPCGPFPSHVTHHGADRQWWPQGTKSTSAKAAIASPSTPTVSGSAIAKAELT